MTPKQFYNSAEWKHARRQALHDAGWQCVRCHCSLIGKGKGANVHHRKAYRRAPALRAEPLNLMPLCTECHNIIEPRTGAGTMAPCSVDGTPLDVEHPWHEANTTNKANS